jgi:hypothetical protein
MTSVLALCSSLRSGFFFPLSMDGMNMAESISYLMITVIDPFPNDSSDPFFVFPLPLATAECIRRFFDLMLFAREGKLDEIEILKWNGCFMVMVIHLNVI